MSFCRFVAVDAGRAAVRDEILYVVHIWFTDRLSIASSALFLMPFGQPFDGYFNLVLAPAVEGRWFLR